MPLLEMLEQLLTVYLQVEMVLHFGKVPMKKKLGQIYPKTMAYQKESEELAV